MPTQSQHYRQKIEELTLLFEISQTLDESRDLHEIISPILERLSDRLGMKHGTLALLNRETNEISIETSVHLTENQQKRLHINQVKVLLEWLFNQEIQLL
ncbi:hypothetical protein [Thiospirochaeta perfilievii]|uniref:hypothetical protein n=1 Tax=Thiospirochaeta perfilievii TaxID=252967 RepID=UPI00319E6588